MSKLDIKHCSLVLENNVCFDFRAGDIVKTLICQSPFQTFLKISHATEIFKQVGTDKPEAVITPVNHRNDQLVLIDQYAVGSLEQPIEYNEKKLDVNIRIELLRGQEVKYFVVCDTQFTSGQIPQIKDGSVWVRVDFL